MYVSNDEKGYKILGSIEDFLQRDLEVTCPLGINLNELGDPSYLPSEERTSIQIKLQAVADFESSCKFTERFWNL